jgi:transcriptional regulator with XRE-family HTH domain
METPPKDTPLRALRKSRGLTLQEVADAIKTDTGNLSRIEQGTQKSLDMARRLVDFYGRDAITELDILYPPEPASPAAEGSPQEQLFT